MSQSIIEVSNLIKEYKIYNSRHGFKGKIIDIFNRQYKRIKAVDNISFRVEPGEIVGYIGLNGAGKSTTIKLLTGIMKSTSGSVKICNINPFEEKNMNAHNVSVIFGQRTRLWTDLPVKDSFAMLKKMYDIPDSDYNDRMKWVKEFVNLDEIWNQQVRRLSLGQRMICDIVAGIIHNPKVLFLDEPTIGLDIFVKDKVRILISEMNKKFNTTIIITTHDMDDIEKLCSRIILIDLGRIIFDGKISDIYDIYTQKRVLAFEASENLDIDKFAGLGNKYAIEINENKLYVKYEKNKVDVNHVVKDVMQYEYSFIGISNESDNLEEVVKKIYTKN